MLCHADDGDCRFRRRLTTLHGNRRDRHRFSGNRFNHRLRLCLRRFRLAKTQARIAALFQYITAESAQGRVFIDLGRIQLQAVVLADTPNPGHTGDRVQADLDERGLRIEQSGIDLQFPGQQSAQGLQHLLFQRLAGFGPVQDQRGRGRRRRC